MMGRTDLLAIEIIPLVRSVWDLATIAIALAILVLFGSQARPDVVEEACNQMIP